MNLHTLARRVGLIVVVLGAAALLGFGLEGAGKQSPVSQAPDTPFKLATFEAQGRVRVGLVLGTRVLDIAEASAHLVQAAGLPAMAVPGGMRELIERYATVAPRLYQIANYFKGGKDAGMPFAFDVAAVSIKAPIKYPWNLIAAAANYKAHAEGMGTAGRRRAAERPSRGRVRSGGDRQARSRS